jgi:hypothetical protein
MCAGLTVVCSDSEEPVCYMAIQNILVERSLCSVCNREPRNCLPVQGSSLSLSRQRYGRKAMSMFNRISNMAVVISSWVENRIWQLSKGDSELRHDLIATHPRRCCIHVYVSLHSLLVTYLRCS